MKLNSKRNLKTHRKTEQTRTFTSVCLKIMIITVTCMTLTACNFNTSTQIPTQRHIQINTIDRAWMNAVDNGINNDHIKIALLLPLSAEGNVGLLATAMKQAATMALREKEATNITLIIRDTAVEHHSIEQIIRQTIREDIDLIIGPILSHSVLTAGRIAQRNNVPIIAFSTDPNAAGNGIYLLSFSLQENIRQAVAYTIDKGKHTFAALIADNVQGTVTNATLLSAAAEQRASVAGIVKYPLGKPITRNNVNDLLRLVNNHAVDALLLPNTLDMAESPALTYVLQQVPPNGLARQGIQLLGSGQWDNPHTNYNPALAGGWYAAPNPDGWNNFRKRYQAIFGYQPPRITTLAYDAVSLAVTLVQMHDQEKPFTKNKLTDPKGFKGLDGIFRFQNNEIAQRALAILELQKDGSSKIIAYPEEFFVQYEPPQIITPLQYQGINQYRKHTGIKEKNNRNKELKQNRSTQPR